MADTVLTLTQLENLFQSLTMTVLGLTDQSLVRVGWPGDGAPVWELSSDVCFLLLRYNDDPITRMMETQYTQSDPNNANANLAYTDVIRVEWNLYGPNSFDHVDLIRANLFMNSTTTTLAASNVALVTDVPMPIRVPELRNGQWVNRATFYANFNELVIRQTTVPYIQTATLNTQQG